MTEVPAPPPAEDDYRSPIGKALGAVGDAVRFFTRIPVPARLTGGAAMADGVAAASPVAGALVGLVAGVALTVALAMGLGTAPASVAAAIAATLASGALHLDGLSDLADGLGGSTPERRLEIMRDSRLGTYGGAALILALAARIALVGALAPRLGAADTVLALVAAGAISRPLAFLPAILLGPARGDGVGRSFRPGRRAALIGFALGVVAMMLSAGAAMGIAGLALGVAAAAVVTSLARLKLGGYTGDVCGAAAEAAELAALAGLLAGSV